MSVNVTEWTNPGGTPSQGKRRGKRTAIVEAAIGLLNVNAGASMSGIAARAGVGRATVHRHFSTRDDLVRAIGLQCMEEMKAAVRAAVEPRAAPAERLRAMFEAVIPLGDRYGFLAFESADDEAVRAGYREQLRWTASLVDDLKAAGEIAPEVPSRWVTAQIDQLVWTAWKGVSDGYLDASQASGLAVRTLFDGLRPGGGRSAT